VVAPHALGDVLGDDEDLPQAAGIATQLGRIEVVDDGVADPVSRKQILRDRFSSLRRFLLNDSRRKTMNACSTPGEHMSEAGCREPRLGRLAPMTSASTPPARCNAKRSEETVRRDVLFGFTSTWGGRVSRREVLDSEEAERVNPNETVVAGI